MEKTISSACGLGGGCLVFNTKMLTWVKAAMMQPAVASIKP